MRQDDWAGTLHRLWSAVAAITSREELGPLIFPPLQALPGVLAIWGLRHSATDGTVTAHRWSGWALEDGSRALAESVPAGEDGTARVVALDGPRYAGLRDRGVTHLITTRLEAPGLGAGTIIVLTGAGADHAFVSECLVQVADITRAAISRLGAVHDDRRQQVRDALLAEASLQMDAVLDSTQTMYRVPRMAVPAVAEGCLVYVLDAGRPVLRSSVHVDMRRLSALLADPAAVQRLDALAGRAASGAAARAGAADAEALGTRTAEVLTLRARGRVIGALVFLFDRDDDRIPPAAFLRDLASRAALAIDNSELYEHRRREVVTMQQHLLPTRLPAVGGLELAASYTVGDQVLEVGGDFYDVVVRDDGTAAVLIGDVCGRGVDAAALTGMARHTLAALLQEKVSAARALSRLNARLRLDGSWRFVTAAIGLLRPAGAGSVTVEWSSAGHPPPIVLRSGGTAAAGRGGGTLLGVLGQARVGRSRLRLAAGDTLIAFTDGLTESRAADGRMFSDGELWAVLDRLRGTPVAELVDELSRAAAGFGTTGADDIAVLAVRVKERHDV